MDFQNWIQNICLSSFHNSLKISSILSSHLRTLVGISSNISKISEQKAIQDSTNREISTNGDFNRWTQGRCRYLCSICEDVFSESKDFVSHISSQHKILGEKYLAIFSDPCITELAMTCKICELSIRHDSATLKDHMGGHPMDLESYYEKFVVKKVEHKQEHFERSVCQGAQFQPQTSLSINFNEHLKDLIVKANPEQIDDDEDDEIECLGTFQSNFGVKSEHTLSQNSNLQFKKEMMSEFANVSAFPIEDPSTILQSTIKEENSSLDFSLNSFSESVGESSQSISSDESTSFKLPWYCGMLFGCKICQSQFFEMSELKRHLSTAHSARYF